MFALAELESVMPLVRASLPPTPQYAWPLLKARTGVDVIVKHENHTPIGAFKVRGGLVYLDRARRERPQLKGIVTATRGNHGQSLAFAGLRAGVTVTIVVPHGNSTEKNAAMRALGAELIEHGCDFDEAREHAMTLAADRGLEFAPSFHRDFVVGVATYAHELFCAVEDIDTVYAPIGLGSGICGLIGTRDLLRPATRIVGVVAERAKAYSLSVAAGRPVRTPPRSPSRTEWRCACRTRPHWRSLARAPSGSSRCPMRRSRRQCASCSAIPTTAPKAPAPPRLRR